MKRTRYMMVALCLFLAVGMYGQQLNPLATEVREAKERNRSFGDWSSLLLPDTKLPARALKSVAPTDAVYFTYDSKTAQQLLRARPAQVSLEIPLPKKGSYILDLVEVPASFYDYVIRTSSGEVQYGSPANGLHYRGVVRGMEEESLVAFSFFADKAGGLISVDKEGNFSLGKIKNSDSHVLYNDRDMKDLPEFKCGTPDDPSVIYDKDVLTGSSSARTGTAGGCVKIYLETTYDIFQQKGGHAGVRTYVLSLFNEVAASYSRIGVGIGLSNLKIWDQEDPYTGRTTSTLLKQFQAQIDSIDGHLGQLLTSKFGNEVAGEAATVHNQLCDPSVDSRLSVAVLGRLDGNIYSVQTSAHEFGHLFGSAHTHSCVWNGNNTAIDGCEPSIVGSCDRPMERSNGTIMSYCNNITLEFSGGIGPNPYGPRDVIRQSVTDATCLTDCSSCEDLELDVSGEGLVFVCEDNPIVTLTAEASSGIYPYEYKWNGSISDSNHPSSYEIRIPPEDVTKKIYRKYVVRVTDKNKCEESETVHLIIIPVRCAYDPNDITGSPGYGPEQWVSVHDPLPYKIRFENDPDFATASAQKVAVTMPIHENLDMFSLRLSDFGFGDFTFSVPPNSTHYSGRLDVRDSLGVYVNVIAGINVIEREAFWIFESVDPATGLPPADTRTGFLPVNDTLTGSGEGFVDFFIQPKSDVQTGDSIRAQASIVFDVNPAIVTNTWVNLIDALPPVSAVDSLPLNLDTTVFTVSWSGRDDAGGSGIGTYALYYKENGGALQLYQDLIPESTPSVLFTGSRGSFYDFFTLATDHVGNREILKDTADLSVNVGITSMTVSIDIPVNACGFNIGCSGTADAEVTATVTGGRPPYTYTWSDGQTTPVATLGAGTYSLTVTDAAGTTALSDTVTLTEPDALTATTTPSTYAGGYSISCAGNSDGTAEVTVAGGCDPYIYLWSDGQATALASGLTAGDYTVEITDANGCTLTEAVSLTEPPTLAAAVGANRKVYLGYAECTTLDAGASGGTPGYTYLWSTGATTATLEVCPAADTEYTVTVTDANGCTTSDTVKVCAEDVACQRIFGLPGVTVCRGASRQCVPRWLAGILLNSGATLGACGSEACGEEEAEDVTRYQQATAGQKQMLVQGGTSETLAPAEPFMEAYPNPFDRSTVIRLYLPGVRSATLKIHDLNGREVAKLFAGEVDAAAPYYELEFVPKPGLPKGVYYYHLTLDNGKVMSKKLVLR